MIIVNPWQSIRFNDVQIQAMETSNQGAASLNQGTGSPNQGTASPNQDAASLQQATAALGTQKQGAIQVPVFLSKQRHTIHVPLEEYVLGVIAAEMPAEFEPEALKAQAIAARTYLVHRMQSGNPLDAVVTDTVADQAYLTDDGMRQKWGEADYARNRKKIQAAVQATKGMIATYKGEPIEATFFSTSNGFTEDAANVWQKPSPYLRSVASPWDQRDSPYFNQTLSVPTKEFKAKFALPVKTGKLRLLIKQRSPNGRVLLAEVNGKQYTGREVREKLSLPSADFRWRTEGSTVVITTKGYGHGVGMSQWGAQGLARMGKTADQILQYYYTGIDIQAMGSS